MNALKQIEVLEKEYFQNEEKKHSSKKDSLLSNHLKWLIKKDMQNIIF